MVGCMLENSLISRTVPRVHPRWGCRKKNKWRNRRESPVQSNWRTEAIKEVSNCKSAITLPHWWPQARAKHCIIYFHFKCQKNINSKLPLPHWWPQEVSNCKSAIPLPHWWPQARAKHCIIYVKADVQIQDLVWQAANKAHPSPI